jgi:hypothetical protein
MAASSLGIITKDNPNKCSQYVIKTILFLCGVMYSNLHYSFPVDCIQEYSTTGRGGGLLIRNQSPTVDVQNNFVHTEY